MKVQFEFSAADLAEVAGRAVNRSPLVQKWRNQGRLASVVLLSLLVYGVTPGEPFVRVAYALLAGCVVAVALARMTRQQSRNARLLKYYREQLGGDGPFRCEVEITETGVAARQLGAESLHPWSQVASVSEVPGGVEVIYRPMGSLLVRDRAFPDAKSRAEFLALCRGFVPAGPQA